MTKFDLEKLLGSADRDPGCDAGLDVIKTENLYNFDGAKGFSA